MRPIVFFDMDGVLCDFVGGVLRLYGKDSSLLESWPPGEYRVHHVLGVSEQEMWMAIERAPCFWEELEPIQAGIDAFFWLLDTPGVDIGVLTSPSMDPACAAGKTDWLQRRLHNTFREYMIGSPKHWCARPSALLIDDNDRNAGKFVEHGGSAIVFPQPWNSRHSHSQYGWRDMVRSWVEVICNET